MYSLKEISTLKISEISLPKLIRNMFIALISTVWLIPALISAEVVSRYMIWLDTCLLKDEQIKGDYPFWVSISPFAILQSNLRIAIFGLMIVIAFWAFVAANRLWPVRRKEE